MAADEKYAQPLTPMQRATLLPVWALHQVMTHQPSENEYGYTCDEMGCLICNAGDEAVEALVQLATEGAGMIDDQPPLRYDVSDRDILMALDDLAAELCD